MSQNLLAAWAAAFATARGDGRERGEGSEVETFSTLAFLWLRRVNGAKRILGARLVLARIRAVTTR